jgi:hypothetical protein
VTFVPGDEVVCVSGPSLKYLSKLQDAINAAGYVRPQKHHHYTVRDTITVSGIDGIFLVEIVNPPFVLDGVLFPENSWRADNFCPVRRESIELFRQMCQSTKPLVPVE